MKKVLSVLLAITVVFGVFPISAMAETGEYYIESISAVATKDLVENMNGHYTTDWVVNGATGQWEETEEYYWYDISYAELGYTVTYDGGQIFTGNENQLYEKFGYWINDNSNQSYENRWKIGGNTYKFSFMGAEGECIVNVIESPIESITAVATKDLIENWHGYYTTDWVWNEETEQSEETEEYFYYYPSSAGIEYTVTYNGGQIFVGNEYELYEKFGYWINDNSNQSYENRWKLGENTYNFNFMGIAGECVVSVIKTPIESISAIAKGDLMQGIDCIVYDDEIEGEYYYYELYNLLEYTVTYDNGKTFTGSEDELYNKFGEWVSINTYNSADNEFSLGKNTVEIEFMNVKGTAEINIIECAYKGVEISGENELAVTLTKNDGSKVEAKVLNYQAFGAGFGEVFGVLETTAGTFYGAHFTWNTRIEENEEMGIYEIEDRSKDLQLTLGKLVSNKIDCNYFKALLYNTDICTMVSAYFVRADKVFQFGASGYSSIEMLASIACYCDGTLWDGDYDDLQGDAEHVEVARRLDADNVNDSIKNLFGITVDVKTLPDYDAETGKFKVRYVDLGWSGFLDSGTLEYKNDIWTYNRMINDNVKINIKLNQDLTVNSIKMIDLNDLICGDLDGDNAITDWDGILLTRYLAGWNVAVPALEVMDIDGNGEVDDWDGILFDRYLAGWDVDCQINK